MLTFDTGRLKKKDPGAGAWGHTRLVGFDAAGNAPALFSDFLFISAIWRDITVPAPANIHRLSSLYCPLRQLRR